MISYDIQHTIPLQTIKQTFFYLKKKEKRWKHFHELF